MNEFYESIYKVVAQIPEGRVLSYGQIAKMLNRPRSAREVGRAMRLCPEELPWHRVVMSDGSIAGGGHAEERRLRLLEEGIPFRLDGRVDMKLCN